MFYPTPAFIGDLGPGTQLRIALKAGHQVDSNPYGKMFTPKKPRRAFGFSRTAFYAFLISNNSDTGTLCVDIQDLVNTEKILNATFNYGDILSIQQVIPQGRPVVETAPKGHPGGAALGTKMAQLFPQPFLIPVLFAGGKK